MNTAATSQFQFTLYLQISGVYFLWCFGLCCGFFKTLFYSTEFYLFVGGIFFLPLDGKQLALFDSLFLPQKFLTFYHLRMAGDVLL